MVEQRISETEAIYEGLYVFDPAVLGPQCDTVKLTVYPENDPDKGDTRVVDPKVLQQITRDFARAAEAERSGCAASSTLAMRSSSNPDGARMA